MGLARQLGLGLAVMAAMAGTVGPAAAQFDAGLPVGTKLPIVSIRDLDGQPFDLATVVGKKPVVFEFWASWCSVCKALMPQLEKVKAEYGDRVAIIGVNIAVNESKERVRRYLAVHKPPFRTLYDDQGVSARAYEVPTTGFIMVVDAAGVVRYTGSGEDQDIGAAVAKVAAK
ncbi:MAG: TlpA family protein disulfide reductase [Gemmatimonadetes bacterium]|nr:TlpA family protein disulfide reductase [Gemmatimonadota bacterium]